MTMDNWQAVADAMAELQENGQLELFIGDLSAGFEVGVDDKGIYLSVCPHCVGEAVGTALGAEDEAAPTHRELH